ncbi:MAG: hypothetical protein KDI30_06475 [Pseudomonadales bacterium]|nr:hypothetical protein [Pseudomonadales bacterium]
MSTSSVKNLLLPRLFLSITCLVVFFTLYQSYNFSTNALLGSDEARYIIRSTTRFFQAGSYADYRDVLFSHHANHLLLGMQLMSIGSYYLTGAINIKLINLFCTFLIVVSGMTILFWKKYFWQQRVFLAAIVMPVLLTPSHNTCMLSAACTANHYFGLALGVISLYLFANTNRGFRFFVFAELLMILSTYSFASGIALCLFAGCLLLFCQSADRYFYCLAHVVISFLLVFSYFFLVSPLESAPVEVSSLAGLLSIFLQILFWFVGACGYAFFWLANDYGVIVFLLGLMLFLSTCIYSGKNIYDILRNHLFLFVAMLYCLSTIGVIATGRYFSFQPTARYSLYAVFFLAFFLALLVDRKYLAAENRSSLPSPLWCFPGLVFVYYLIGFSVHYPDAVDLHQRGVICESRWRKGEHPNQKGASCAQFMKVDEMQVILDEAAEIGIFDPAQ